LGSNRFLGGEDTPRPADRERLRRQLGLDQPVYVQYLVWLAGNDWMKIDMDGDGVAETPGKRLGVLRGDFGDSLVSKRPVLEVITERLPNTLLLMVCRGVGDHHLLAHYRNIFSSQAIFVLR